MPKTRQKTRACQIAKRQTEIDTPAFRIGSCIAATAASIQDSILLGTDVNRKEHVISKKLQVRRKPYKHEESASVRVPTGNPIGDSGRFVLSENHGLAGLSYAAQQAGIAPHDLVS